MFCLQSFKSTMKYPRSDLCLFRWWAKMPEFLDRQQSTNSRGGGVNYWIQDMRNIHDVCFKGRIAWSIFADKQNSWILQSPWWAEDFLMDYSLKKPSFAPLALQGERSWKNSSIYGNWSLNYFENITLVSWSCSICTIFL